LFQIFVAKFAELPFLRSRGDSSPGAPEGGSKPVQFTGDDDLDLGIYYLRALSNVFRWAPDNIWAVLAAKTASSDLAGQPLSEISEFTPLPRLSSHAIMEVVS
jgi:hypothetical protein